MTSTVPSAQLVTAVPEVLPAAQELPGTLPVPVASGCWYLAVPGDVVVVPSGLVTVRGTGSVTTLPEEIAPLGAAPLTLDWHPLSAPANPYENELALPGPLGVNAADPSSWQAPPPGAASATPVRARPPSRTAAPQLAMCRFVIPPP